MVRFEKDKLVIEIQGYGDPIYNYFRLVKALYTVTGYAVDLDPGGDVLLALTDLNNLLGVSLGSIDEDQLDQIYQTLSR